MNCFDEKRLEQMILEDAGMNRSEREHLLICDRCRKSYLTLLALHQEMITCAPVLLKNAAKSVKDQKAGDAFITTLQPLSLSGSRGFDSSRLAAQGEQPASSYQVSSYSNPKKGMVGRLLYDQTTHHLQFFLLNESATTSPGVKVVLDQGQLVGFTDNQGCVDFGEQPQCQCEQVHIITPNCSVDLTQHQGLLPRLQKYRVMTEPQHLEEEIEIDIAHTEAGICYTITLKKANPKRKPREVEVVGITSQRVLTARSQNGKAVLEIRAGEELHKIHIY